MEFTKLFNMFNDEEDRLSDVLSEVAEGRDPEDDPQKIWDDHIEWLKNNDTELMLKVDEAFGALISAHMDVGFVAGFIFGQAFDMVDPEGLKEIHSLKARLEAEGVIHYWPRKKAPDNLRGEPGASSE